MIAGGHRDHARRAKNYGAIRQARGRPENVRRPDAIHAVEGELRRRHADHFRLGAPAFPDHDRELAFRTARRPDSISDMLSIGWLHYVVPRGDDFLLQLFLGRDAIPAVADRGRSEEVRRLHSRRAARANRLPIFSITP